MAAAPTPRESAVPTNVVAKNFLSMRVFLPLGAYPAAVVLAANDPVRRRRLGPILGRSAANGASVPGFAHDFAKACEIGTSPGWPRANVFPTPNTPKRKHPQSRCPAGD